jgi:putative inorganic carbon (HCO3(-)) transporter
MSRGVALATFFYLAHIFCAGWVASSELGTIFFAATVAYLIWKKELRPSFHILYFPLFVYALDSSVSSFANGASTHAFGEIALWLKCLLFPAALILFRNVPRTRELAVKTFLAFGIFSSLYGFVQYFLLHQRDLEHRITGPAAHVMTYSGLMLPVALMFLILWVHDRRNLWLAGGTVLTTLTLLMTFTRSAWLGWLCAVLVVAAFKRPRLLAYAVPVGILVITFLPLPYFARLASSFDTKQSSNFDRIRMFQGGVEIIKDFPVLGVGPGNMKEVYPLYRKPDAPRFRIPHLHNNLVQLWAERGILALAAYVTLIVLFLRECARGWHTKWAEVGVAVTVGLAVAGMFEFNFGDTEVFLVMLDVFALVAAYVERNEDVAMAVPVPRTASP